MDIEEVKQKIRDIVSSLEFISVRSDFIDPIMFQQIGPSTMTDSNIDSFEESMKKSDKLIEAYKQSVEMTDDAISKINDVEDALIALKTELTAHKDKMSQLIDNAL